MSKLYFFTSSYRNDKVNNITIFTSNVKKAYSLAFRLFAKHDCRGIPRMLFV